MRIFYLRPIYCPLDASAPNVDFDKVDKFGFIRIIRRNANGVARACASSQFRTSIVDPKRNLKCLSGSAATSLRWLSGSPCFVLRGVLDLAWKNGEHLLRKQEVFYGQRELGCAGVLPGRWTGLGPSLPPMSFDPRRLMPTMRMAASSPRLTVNVAYGAPAGFACRGGRRGRSRRSPGGR